MAEGNLGFIAYSLFLKNAIFKGGKSKDRSNIAL